MGILGSCNFGTLAQAHTSLSLLVCQGLFTTVYFEKNALANNSVSLRLRVILDLAYVILTWAYVILELWLPQVYRSWYARVCLQRSC